MLSTIVVLQVDKREGFYSVKSENLDNAGFKVVSAISVPSIAQYYASQCSR